MVGFLGFLVLAVGGGALAIYLGVPPIYIGGYIVGLLLLGAITGFSGGSGSRSSGGGGGRSSGGSGGGSGGSSGGFLNSAMDAAGGFLDGLSGSGSSSSSGRSSTSHSSGGSGREVGSVSTTDPDGRREVGSFGNPKNEDSLNNHATDTTEEDYLNEELDSVNMSDDSGFDYRSLEELESGPLSSLIGGEELEQAAKDVQEEIKREKREMKYNQDILDNLNQVVADYSDIEPALEEAIKIEKLQNVLPDDPNNMGWEEAFEFEDQMNKQREHFKKIMQVTGAESKAQALQALNDEVQDIANRLDQVISDLRDEDKLFKQEKQEEGDLKKRIDHLRDEHLQHIARVDRQLDQLMNS
ncbi:MAG: hypothetical protein ABEK04_05105 [Candidatus Nanohalobium sp.]